MRGVETESGSSFIDLYTVYIQNVLSKGRSFTANSGTKVAVLRKSRPYTANTRTKVVVLVGMNGCNSTSPTRGTIHSVSKTFGESYQKTNKMKYINKFSLLPPQNS